MTDRAIITALEPKKTQIIWKPDKLLPLHPMEWNLKALQKKERLA